MRRVQLVACVAAILTPASGLGAQQSAPARASTRAVSLDTVAGRVRSRDSTPVFHAQVRIRADVAGDVGGMRRRTEILVYTDTTGTYKAVVRGTGTYEIRARAFGYVPLTVFAQRDSAVARSARIERDLVLDAIAVTLESVRVVGRTTVHRQAAPADQLSRWLSISAERLPRDPGDLAGVAALEPGIAALGSDPRQVSIMGQAPDQNRVTIDGVTAGAGSSAAASMLPAEGVRTAGVVTNSYDVALGNFSGGQITGTTMSGTNTWGSSMSSAVSPSSLTYGIAESAPARHTDRARLSAGGGGAIVANRLFAYAAADITHVRGPVTGIDRLDAAALQQIGLSPDSLGRLHDIATRIGIPTGGATTPDARRDFVTGYARFDYVVSDAHSLTLRIDDRSTRSTDGAASSLIPGPPDTFLRSHDAGVLVSLTSSLGDWTNELRAHRTSGRVTSGTSSHLPTGTVEILSMPFARDGPSTIAASDTPGASPLLVSFGGGSFDAGEHHELLELSDDMTHQIGDGRHEWHAGMLVQSERVDVLNAINTSGTFAFESVQDLADGHPMSFTRTLAGGGTRVPRLDVGAYVGDNWRVRPRLRVTYGLRLDGAHAGARRTLAPEVQPLAPGASARIPARLALTPRFGFYQGIGSSSWAVEGGIGGFTGVTPLVSLAGAVRQTGRIDNGDLLVTCVGPAAPVPDWRAFTTDPTTIPSSCGSGGSANAFGTIAPAVTVFSRRYGGPQTWRASLGVSGNVTQRWGIGASAIVVHGVHEPSAIERNLAVVQRTGGGAQPERGFALAEELDRPMFAPAFAIDPATGGIAPSAARRDPRFGSVRELGADGESSTTEVTASANGFVGSAVVGVFYTEARSRVRSNGIPAPGVFQANTAGDPNQRTWSAGPFTPEHTLQLMLTGGVARHVSLSAIGRLQSGVPFTPMVAGDINGDGLENDRAFIFDPRTTVDPAVADAMRTLLSTAPPEITDCLRRQVGRIAAAASCRTPWVPSLDVRAIIRPFSGTRDARRFALTITASNVSAGFDYMLHGPSGLHGWGQYPSPDPILLDVRGFDPARRAFVYAINPRFGQDVDAGIAARPFSVSVEARVAFGADPRFQPLLADIVSGVGDTRRSIRDRLAERVHNVPAVVLQLDMGDSSELALTIVQRAALGTLADSIGQPLAAAVDTLVASLIERGPMTALRRVRLQRRSEAVERLIDEGTRGTRTILTPAQFRRLPAWLLNAPDTTTLRNTPITITERSDGP